MKAQEAGKIVVLASGRPTAGVEPLAKELELARFEAIFYLTMAVRSLTAKQEK